MQDLTVELVADLVRQQHPDLAHLPVRFGARGWDNQLWRLGDNLVARLPWATDSADALLRKEFAWLPALAPRLPLPVPVPQRLSEPSPRFPRPWLITTWVSGTPADVAPLTCAIDAGRALATFLSALHHPAPHEAPSGRDRGGPLADRAEGFARGLAAAVEAGLVTDPEAVRAMWDDALSAPPWTGSAVWLHADLHPANVLIGNGTICGVIDFGDLCAGDPAYDLAAAWLLLPTEVVGEFLSTYSPSVDDATVRRARGWAMARALSGLLIGDAGIHGRPGGQPTGGPPAYAAMQRLIATAQRRARLRPGARPTRP